MTEKDRAGGDIIENKRCLLLMGCAVYYAIYKMVGLCFFFLHYCDEQQVISQHG